MLSSLSPLTQHPDKSNNQPSKVLGFILNDPASEITATVLCGYGAYLTAEVLGASGVLSMVGAHAYVFMYVCHASKDTNAVSHLYPPSIRTVVMHQLTSNRPTTNPPTKTQVAAGLYLSFHGLGRISARVTGSLKSFWSMADYIANTVRPWGCLFVVVRGWNRLGSVGLFVGCSVI